MANKAGKSIEVEVVYARAEHIWRRQLVLQNGATALQAVEASGILQAHPELSEKPPVLGIFGRISPGHHPLLDGDRVEIYRPLVFDPMESRRRRLKHRQRQIQEGKGQGGKSGSRSRASPPR